MSTMKAVRFYEYGGPEVLRYEDVPRPEAAAGEVVVRVHAASVNPVDWKIREGYLQKMIPHRLPLVPGGDLSGVVEREGAGVTAWKPGDEVYGRADIRRDGTFAEYVAVKASDVVRKPRSIDHVHAAAVPLAGLSAWQALIEKMAVGKGQTVLIQGAAGGIGTFAVQLARWRGASVVATASSGNVGFLKELGVDKVIDHAAERFEAVVHDVDAVFDLVGGETLTRSIAVVKPGGVLVAMAGQPSEEAAKVRGIRAMGMMTRTDAAQLDELTKLIEARILKPVVSQVFPLSEARKALELSQTRHARGKVVVSVVA